MIPTKHGKRKIHIRVHSTDISDVTALVCVLKVVEQGRLSGGDREYCAVTTFTNGLVVAASTTRAGDDSFWVGREERV